MSETRKPPILNIIRKGAARRGDRKSRTAAGAPAASGPGPRSIAGRDYLRDPEEIYRRSFELIRRETRLDHLPSGVADIVVRLVHACGMPEIVGDIAYYGNVGGAARAALDSGMPVFCDARMVAAGILQTRLPYPDSVVCTLDHPDLAALMRWHKTTRSAAAVELWRGRLGGAVVAIGNAPTALFHLIETIERGGPRPAAIFAFPVGFVGAVESKEALISAGLDVPYLTLRGRCGGSALAAAAVNALLVPHDGAAA